MSWGGSKGPQGPFFFFIFLAFTLAQTIPQHHQKNDRSVDLIFDDYSDSNSAERNLVLSGRSNKHKTSVESKRGKRFEDWGFDDDETTERTESTIKDSTRPSLQTTKKETTVDGKFSPSPLTKRTIVPVSDDEDLVSSGDDGIHEGSGDFSATSGRESPSTTISHSPSSSSSYSTTGRSDTSETRRFFRISLTIGKSWSPALEQRSSSAFKMIEEELEHSCSQTLEFEIESFSIINFIDIGDSAFVRCVFDMGLIGHTKEEVEAAFNPLFDGITMGSLRVKKEGFSVRDVGKPLLCHENELQCNSGECISITMKCDSSFDCADGSDEHGCPDTSNTIPSTLPSTTRLSSSSRHSTTQFSSTTRKDISSESEEGDKNDLEIDKKPDDGKKQVDRVPVPNPRQPDDHCRADDQVRCSDGKTFICSDQKCDGHPDCPDEDDEFNCDSTDACEPGHFSCDLTKCKPQRLKCNGVQDCDDGSDETGCRGRIVSACGERSPDPHTDVFKFKCMSGSCVPISARCNNRRDCDDASDEVNCQCLPFEWECETGDCIPRDLYCNGQVDCLADGSDEKYCNGLPETQNPRLHHEDLSESTFLCRRDEFRCSNGVCIDLKLRCNKHQDCSDNSDETGDCPCADSTEFKCGTGLCIPISQRCDSINQCNDMSDEKNCPKPSCSSSEFKCSDGFCIPKNQRCNNRVECPDGSDEHGCPLTCRPDEFKCAGGDICVNIGKRCDHVEDCPRGDDEHGCGPSLPCNSFQFQCTSGTCIEKILVCDGIFDCQDGSDELRCHDRSSACNGMEFQCGDGSCMSKSLLCNGKRDCNDGIDESNCSACRPEAFQCEIGGCIEAYQVCDNIPDCSDHSDEHDCSEHCGMDDILCADGTCIPSNLKCNGQNECSDGSDEENCDGSPRPSCRSDEFLCGDGTCIPDFFRCDGHRHCSYDGSDEESCPNCRNSFRCSNGSCIDSVHVCNGRSDCRDGSDERNCVKTCNPDQFRCDDGECIPLAYRCDKLTDCVDRSDEDERTCGTSKPDCTDNQFQCHSGGCVPKSAVCNQQFDCADASDEQNCPTVCRSDEFRCSNGKCIPISLKCNKARDCHDGSDEVDCPQIQPPLVPCLPGQFTCRSRDQCVSNSAICNGQYDCNDFSDEERCAGPPGGLNLKTYPAEQIIKQGNEVVFQCRDEGPQRAPVRWARGNGLPLPPASRDYSGRLEMPNIMVEHTGTYICEAIGYPASTPGARVSVYLRVDSYEPVPTRPPTACGINEATCNSGECISKHLVCDGELDCADGSDELRCKGKDGCEPNEFMCSNKRCISKAWRCDGDDDCGDNTDEHGCTPPPPGSPCRYNEFRCENGIQCVPKAFHCDKEFDCTDRSDEKGCSKPVIQRPPPNLITIDVGDVFNISCKAHGVPTAEVIWRKNWAHIPDKCYSTSVNGFGILTCESIQIPDQGAYSCEAINTLGSTFAIPDCQLVVRPPSGVCSPGFFNSLASNPRDCLPCFCFSHRTDSSTCDSVKLYITQLPPPENNYRLIGLSQDVGSGTVEIQDRRHTISASTLRPYPPSGIQAVSSGGIRTIPVNVIPFFALPPSYNGNMLRSYGGYLNYTLRFRGSSRTLAAPDVVIRGNGVTLIHAGGENWAPGRDHQRNVRIWAGEWFKRIVVRGDGPVEGADPASREEIMMVLANLDFFLIRAKYDQGIPLDTTISDIRMDTASSTNSGQGQAIYVEECRCPPGYTGLSCEECAPGYERRQHGRWLGTCEKKDPTTCPIGQYLDQGTCRHCPCPGGDRRFGSSCFSDTDSQITCQCNPGHSGRNCEQCAPGYEQSRDYPYECRPSGLQCDVEGSLSPNPDPFTGRCICKDFATGHNCNQCKANTFFLNSRNQYGCVSCFCMGVTTYCSSSNYYRTQETSVFVQSANGFTLVDESQRNVIRDGFSFDRNSRELGFKEFSRLPLEIYYWQLPFNFLGDKVTSYGGYLNYTIRHVPPPSGHNSPNTAADVEINGNDVRLLYFRKTPVPPNKKETISVPLLEQYWQRQDGQPTNREHFLMTLANLDALLIKATYTTSTKEAHLSEVSLDMAVSRNTGQDRAYAVEQCTCPQGYIGLSCQECAFGYTRDLSGLYLGFCEPCSCNGHSEECDSRTGVCRNCRGHTTGDFCEQCDVGYIGDPRTGECKSDKPGCFCDQRGSAGPDCPDGQSCICKGNVEGTTCNLCKPGTFALQEVNPMGCLDCFCSQLSTECSSANLYRITIDAQVYSGPHGFVLTDSLRLQTVQEINLDGSSGELSYRYPSSDRSERLFWSLPPKFTGNRIASYGGKLRATRRYYVQPGSEEKPVEDIDAIIVGNNGVSLFWIYHGAILPGQEVGLEVNLRETAGWRHLDGPAGMASREELLSVLVDLQAILIRASFSDEMESTHIKGVSMDDAVRQYTPNGIVMDVEECKCPQGYDGLSCEMCGPGYYRDSQDRSKGPSGSCKACPCGHNAEGCTFDRGHLTCLCRPGYTGPNCEQRDRVQVELYPVKVKAFIGAEEEFICSYESRIKLLIEFETFPKTAGVNPPVLSSSNSLKVFIPITPTLQRVICRITNEEGGTVAEVFAKVEPVSGSPDIPEPLPSPQILVTVSEPIIQVVQVGSSVSFRCSGRSLSGTQLRIKWSREGGAIPSGRARDDGQGLLVISEVRPQDSGTYICAATDGIHRNTDKAILTIAGGGGPPGPPSAKPEISINPRFLTVEVGELVEFRCTATGFPQPVITWSGGRDGFLGNHIRINGGVLQIPRAKKSDEAEYFCSGHNNAGTSSLRTILYVKEEESVSPIVPPEFGFVVTISPTDYEARPGESVRYRCDCSDRDSEIQWTKFDGTLPPTASISPDGILNLFAVRELDSGLYICTATSPTGQTTKSQARLAVSYIGSPPTARIEPERQTVPQGSPIEIRCVVSGTPTPSIEWTKVGSSLSPSAQTSDEVLRIPAAQVSDRGVYVCTVENSAGKSLGSGIVEVERREPPQIELFPGPRQTVIKDGSALFQCRVTAGIPSPRVTWTRGNGQRLPANVEEIQGGVIRFNRVTGEEKGQYICSAESISGTTTATAFLDVHSPPKVSITPEAPHRVRSGEQVRLECRAEGEPLPTVSWRRLSPGQLEGVDLFSSPSGTPQTAVYTITKVTKSDEGSYSCTGRNEAGIDEGRIQLLIDDSFSSEKSPSKGQEENYYFPVGSRAELRCIQGGLFDQLYLDWERSDNGPMPRDYDAIDGVLYINNVRHEDAGRYSCTGTNRQGQVVLTVDARLEVIGTSPPSIELQPARQIVRRGDTVKISCIAKGDQPITINWFKTDRKPFPSSVIVNGPQLTFRGIEVTDAGRYACQATNAGGTAESVAEVIVHGSGPPVPRPQRREQIGFIGQRVDLHCLARGTRVLWKKDQGPLSSTAIPLGNILTLMSLKLTDAGRYTCETDQGSDYIDLSVEGIDVETIAVRIHPSKELLKIGEDVDVLCEVTGDPSATIRWSKVIGEFADNVQTIENVLKVIDVTQSNGGVYRCIATTKNGIFEQDYALTIQANPNNGFQNSATVETRTAPFGSTVRMDCQTDLEEPIEYSWSKQGGLIPTLALAHGPTLTIPDLSPEDAGTYICSASNPETPMDIPTVLVVTGVVPYFTQAPTSYMTLPTLPDSYLKFDIEISFKPEDKNGLILYNGQKRDGSGDFISLGISNGVPEFRFDVGSGPAVIRGDTPLEIGVWHTVKLNRDKTEGMMIIDEKGPYIGNIKGGFQGLDLLEPMYIGGVPNFNQIHRLNGQNKGFVGCVSELIISGKKQQLLRDLQTSRGVSTCDTCIVNTCINNGVCQEGLTNRGFSCICPPGYSGENCEIPGESCYPGACGVGKCVNVVRGFECFCPFGKAGERCERDVTIVEPSFSKDSYLSYPTPKALKKLKIGFKVKAHTFEDGILMYSSQTEDGMGDYTALAIKDKRFEFQYDTGSGPAIIRSLNEIILGEWVEVTIERNLQEGQLIINGNEKSEGKSPGTTRGLNLKTPLYIGGYDKHRLQLNSNLKVERGFFGCLSELVVFGMEIDIVNSVLEGANVDNCGYNPYECPEGYCHNGGTCYSNETVEFTCECPHGFNGLKCEIKDTCVNQPCLNGGTCHIMDNTYKCACFKGFHGRNCQEVTEFSESVAFRGEGYLELSYELFPHDYAEENEIIELEISTTKAHGLIFWHGQKPTDVDPDDYVAIGLIDGKIEFSYDIGHGSVKIISNKRVDDGKKHKITLKRQGADGMLEIDNDHENRSVGSSPGQGEMLNTRGNIYIGGVPNPSRMTHGKFSDGFIGCIHSLRFQDSPPINLNEKAVSAINTGPCSSHEEHSPHEDDIKNEIFPLTESEEDDSEDDYFAERIA